ncbi:PREDICTED: uncharacterized protein LOC107120515 [Gekko japonicus]|uniref:Gypsy retrotransposon integrase-like protein 1 n=1 Tax=Gekko japonicus TaxID=146911 RepID=A0ABM1KYC9_GEKJA|nr:PREDICTED: uncharacterized protein LOC107120515 [Gekko japonicus]
MWWRLGSGALWRLGNRVNLLGLEWFEPLGIALTGVNVVSENKWAVLYNEFPDVFGGGLGKYKGPPVSFELDPSVTPIRLKYRKVPIPLKPRIEAELDKLIAQGVLEPVPFRGKVFAKFDLAQAYQQLPVTREAAEAQTIVTHRGAFRVNRLQIDEHGVHPTEDKVRAIKDAPCPGNKKELQAFLGLLNFYHAFLPHKASVAAPLHALLHKEAKWRWGSDQERAFKGVKALLVSNAVLTHYDDNKMLVLAADASPYGVGAVLSHLMPNGEEAPVAFYSRSLSSAEKGYAQIDKEGLALVAAVKKFHDFLYGRKFLLVTDHKPLLGIFAPDRQLPNIMSARMLRWALFLSAYDYDLEHRPGKAIGHADALSRCPLPGLDSDPAPANEVLAIDELSQAPITSKDIAAASAKDIVISRVLNWVWRGWPVGSVEPEFACYKMRQNELSVSKGCLLWGSRVVVPHKLREKVLKSLHEGHPGMVHMKALARGYVWWPRLDADIEEWVRVCEPCQQARPEPPTATPQRWESAGKPWSRLHLDFAGPVQGQMFLVIVDAYTKWLEVAHMRSTTSSAVVTVLRQLFATHGLPDVLVSDNGAQFTSEEFRRFLSDNGIRQMTAAPFHPASNGQAERMVRTTKEALAKLVCGDWGVKLASFLLRQHVTPCSATGRSPAEMLMGRRLATLLDRLHPDLNDLKPQPQTESPKVRTYEKGEQVYARNYASGHSWLPATVTDVIGTRMVMAVAPGHLEVIDPTHPEFWESWVDQLTCFFTYHEVTDAGKKRVLLLSTCGVATIRLAKSLLAPKTLLKNTYNEIVAALTRNYAPKPTTMAKHMDFQVRLQKLSETAAAFMADLHQHAMNCGFTMVKENILTQFVWGLKDVKLGHKLVGTADLKIDGALQMATAYEGSHQDHPPSSLHHVLPAATSDNSDEDEVLQVCQPSHRKPQPQAGATVPQGTQASQASCASYGDSHERKTCCFRDAVC